MSRRKSSIETRCIQINLELAVRELPAIADVTMTWSANNTFNGYPTKDICACTVVGYIDGKAITGTGVAKRMSMDQPNASYARSLAFSRATSQYVRAVRAITTNKAKRAAIFNATAIANEIPARYIMHNNEEALAIGV